MFLMSAKLLKLMEWLIKYGYFLKVHPYRWDHKSCNIYHSDSKFGVFSWHCVSVLFFAHQAFLVVRLSVSIHAQTRGYTHYILLCVYTVGLFIPTVLQLALITKCHQIAAFLQRYTVLATTKVFKVSYVYLYLLNVFSNVLLSARMFAVSV